MITVAEAQEQVIAAAQPLPAVDLRLEEAGGLVLAQEILAPSDLPPFTQSAMDGFALRSRETAPASPDRPLELNVAGESRPGQMPHFAVGPREAGKILTGAPLPDGTDAVVKQEEVKIRQGRISVLRPVGHGEHVRRQGEEFRRRDLVLKAGQLLTPPAIGLLAALRVPRVQVHPRPAVGLLTTGDEVRPPQSPLSPGTVGDANAPALGAALGDLGIRPAFHNHVPDREGELERALSEAGEHVDVLVITGGVSVGDRDLVRPTLEKLGVETIFWGVQQKPGKPLYFGHAQHTLIFGLPGNPASALVCFHEYVRPALLRLAGHGEVCLPASEAALIEPIESDSKRTQFLRGVLEFRNGRPTVRSAGAQGSHLLSSFTRANCLIVLPPRSAAWAAGERVIIHLLPWAKPLPTAGSEEPCLAVGQREGQEQSRMGRNQ